MSRIELNHNVAQRPQPLPWTNGSVIALINNHNSFACYSNQLLVSDFTFTDNYPIFRGSLNDVPSRNTDIDCNLPIL